MTLTELRYIVTLAQEQHFGRAAERCCVSQPTLSIAVKKLEEELNTSIFERSKSRVYVTQIGEKIVEQAQKVLTEAATVKDIANAAKDPLNGKMRIGAILTVGPYILPHMVPEIQAMAKDMPLYLEEDYTGELRKRLRRGELDAIVVALPFNEPDVETSVLYDEDFVVVMSESHPLAKFEAISPEQLDTHTVLLLGEGHCFRDQVLDVCPNLKRTVYDESSSELNAEALEGSSLETLKYMVASGLGMSILPASAANPDNRSNTSLAIRPFVEPIPKRRIALAWRTRFTRIKAIELLREAILRSQTKYRTA